MLLTGELFADQSQKLIFFCQGWRGKREGGETLRCLQVDDADSDGVDGDDADSDDADGVDGDVDDDAQVGVSSWMLEGRGSLQ